MQAGISWNRLEISAANDDYTSRTRFDRNSTIRWNAAQASRLQDDQRWRYQLDPTVTWVKKGWLGEHTVKFGAQLSYRTAIATSPPAAARRTPMTPARPPMAAGWCVM